MSNIRINYDDQPNEVAEKFVSALQKVGIIIMVIDTPEDATYMDYSIVAPGKAADAQKFDKTIID